MAPENDEYNENKATMQIHSWQRKLREAAMTNNYEDFAEAAKHLSAYQMFMVKDSDGRNVFQMSLRYAENGDITKTAAYKYITQDNPNWETSEKIARAAWQPDGHNYSILSYLEAHVNDPGGVSATMLKLKEHLDQNPKYQVSDNFKDYYDQLLITLRTPIAYGYNRQRKQEADEYIESYPDRHHDPEFAASVADNTRKYGKVGKGGRDDY